MAVLEGVHTAQLVYWMLCHALVGDGVPRSYTNVVPKYGYIVFCDSNLIIIYCNDLTRIRRVPVDGLCDFTAQSVYGLAPLIGGSL